MYLPFTAISRWNDAIACYTDLYTIGNDTYLRNEAYDDPRHEMKRPALCFHAPLKDRPTSGNLVFENTQGQNGTWAAGTSQANLDSPVIQDGPNSLLAGQQCVRVTSTENASAVQKAGFYLNGNNTQFGMSIWYKLDDHTASSGPQTIAMLHVPEKTGFPTAHTGMSCSLNLDRSSNKYRPYVSLSSVGVSPATAVTLAPDMTENPWETDYYHSGWNHVVFSYVGGGGIPTIKMWLNGREVDTATTSITLPTPDTLNPVDSSYFPTVYLNRTDRSTTSGIDGALAFFNVYTDRIDQKDVHRHYQSMIRGLDLKLNEQVVDLPLRNRTDAQYTRTFTWDHEEDKAQPRALNFQLDESVRPYAFQSCIAEKTQQHVSFIGGIQLKDEEDIGENYSCQFFRHMSRINRGDSAEYQWTDLIGTTHNSSIAYITPYRGWSFERLQRNMLVRWHDGDAIEHRTLQTTGSPIGGWQSENVPKYEVIGGSVDDTTDGQALAGAGPQVVTYDRPGGDNWRLDQGESSFLTPGSSDHVFFFSGGQDVNEGGGVQDHYQRLGPVAVMAEPMDESKYRFMRRIMLGQKPLRTRRPTRTVYRHIGLTGPSRIIQ